MWSHDTDGLCEKYSHIRNGVSRIREREWTRGKWVCVCVYLCIVVWGQAEEIHRGTGWSHRGKTSMPCGGPDFRLRGSLPYSCRDHALNYVYIYEWGRRMTVDIHNSWQTAWLAFPRDIHQISILKHTQHLIYKYEEQ